MKNLLCIVTVLLLSGNVAAQQAVDLGLSVLWADCNVGAAGPEDAGIYVAWGELQPKDEYLMKNYRFCSGEFSSPTKYFAYDGNETFTEPDGKTVLEPEDDVATVMLGSGWRSPSHEEFQELANSCTWEWIADEAHPGYRVTGPNGNSIFLPAAGIYTGSKLMYNGHEGYYWTSQSLYIPDNAYCLRFTPRLIGHPNFKSTRRFNGCTVRAVAEATSMPLVIFDTDIASSADDLFALEMLYRYEDEGRCRLLGVVVDREGERNAAFADVMNTYFGHGDVPVGLVRDGIKEPKVWIDYAHVADTKDGEGQPMFRRSVADYSQLSDGWRLYRRLLAAQPDHSVSIVSVGFVTCLAQLLTSGADEYSSLTGVELVRRKVKCIYLQGGVFGEAVEPDFNFAQSITFAKTFFQNWPQEVDMVFSPMEVGQDVEYTPGLVIADVSWTDAHPIKQVYMQCDCNTGQRMWDVMPVVQAVEGDTLFTLSQRGTVRITDQAETIFTPSATGNVRYQLPGSEAWAAQMLEKIRRYNKMK